MIKRGNIVREYLRRFPNTPSKSLARKIYKEQSKFFKDEESIRSLLRYYRGQFGKDLRKVAHLHKENFVSNLYKLPTSHAEKAKVFRVPVEHNNVLVISDIHIPYQDNQALEVAFKYGKEQKINCIFINGDLIDFFMISKFAHLERKLSVAQELEMTRQFLDYLNQEFPQVPIYYLLGNHDNRLQMYLAVKAPELLDVEEFKLEVLLDSETHNMKVFEDITLVKLGKLSVTHGHNLLRGFFSPVNPARGAFLKAKSPVLIGHLHKISTHSETTITGKPITCYSTGCLCELNPRYTPFANNFSHGFAHVQFEASGSFRVRNLQILEGNIVS